jgi:hypothetical protein
MSTTAEVAPQRAVLQLSFYYLCPSNAIFHMPFITSSESNPTVRFFWHQALTRKTFSVKFLKSARNTLTKGIELSLAFPVCCHHQSLFHLNNMLLLNPVSAK